MNDPSVVAAKLADLSERIAMVRKHRAASADDYAANPEARDLVAFNLMLAVQSAAEGARTAYWSAAEIPSAWLHRTVNREGRHCT